MPTRRVRTVPTLFDALGREALDREFQRCSLRGVDSDAGFTVAGLFAGIGGMERGLARAGGRAELLCEWWEPAKAVLARRFPDVPLVGDVRDLKSLPKVDVVAAGFPCTDLSQAGRTAGSKEASRASSPRCSGSYGGSACPLLVLENVRNMLVLDSGEAMRYLVTELELLGYRWAYRLVDSRFTGVPQRRQRVIFVAARDVDPRAILFADDVGGPRSDRFHDDCFGFYWTEGLRGLGWAQDAVPTLKGGPPSASRRRQASGTPRASSDGASSSRAIEDAERLQGFPRGWTAAGDECRTSQGHPVEARRQRRDRWRVGMARVSAFATRASRSSRAQRMQAGERWPNAAFGAGGKVWTVDVSMWPTHERYQHLAGIVDLALGSAVVGTRSCWLSVTRSKSEAPLRRRTSSPISRSTSHS